MLDAQLFLLPQDTPHTECGITHSVTHSQQGQIHTHYNTHEVTHL